MRNLVLGLAGCLALTCSSNAEVVVSNNAGTGSSVSSTSGDGIKYSFTTGDAWQAPTTTGGYWSLSSLKFFGGDGDKGNWTISILQGSTSLASQSFSNVTVASGVATLNFDSTMTSTLLNSTTTYSIQAVYNSGALGSFTDTDGVYSYGTLPSGAAFTNGGGVVLGNTVRVAKMELSASAVPEPGTLLLGGIAACSGAAEEEGARFGDGASA